MSETEVLCLINRSWDPRGKTFVGEEKQGVLLSFLTIEQDGYMIPAGVVCFADNTFEAVPLEFIEHI